MTISYNCHLGFSSYDTVIVLSLKKKSLESFSPYTQTNHIVEDNEDCDNKGSLLIEVGIIEVMHLLSEDAS